jgi:aspartate/glutamate racemase
MIKTIGIIGGHGYNATIHFQQILCEEFNKKFLSRKYLKTIVINNSTLYSDLDNFDNIYNNNNDNNELFKIDINKNYELLKNLNVDLIVLPCNTYSYYLTKINLNSEIKIMCLNIIEETCKFINNNLLFGGNNTNIKPNIKIGIISTKQTIENNLYHKNLKCELYYNSELLDDISLIIFCSQYGYFNKEIDNEFKLKYNLSEINLIEKFNNIIDIYLKNNVTHIILGCTELPLFYYYNKEKLNNKINYISSTQILAESSIKYLFHN